MSVTHSDFLRSAKNILRADDEIAIRNAVSRAYYAAYHCSLALDHGFGSTENQNGGIHTQWVQRLTSHPNMKFKSVGYILNTLRGRRATADYDLENDIDDIFAQTVISDTERLIRKVDEALSS